MRIAILSQPGSWYLGDLRRAAEARHEIVEVSFRDVAANLGLSSAVVAGQVDLASMNAILVRTMPPGSLEQIVFRMDALAQLEASGVRVINPPKSLETAVDKYLALARIAAAGIPVPKTIVCQGLDHGMSAFETLGGDIVVKPLFGSEGRGIARISDESIAHRTFNMLAQLGAVIYVQQFVPHHGFDIRVLFVGDRVLTMKRRHPTDWRTNISRGAIAEPIDLESHQLDLARRAAAAIGAPVAGVDLLPALDGTLYVIEVNAVPGWKAIAQVTQTDVAKLVLDFVESRAG